MKKVESKYYYGMKRRKRLQKHVHLAVRTQNLMSQRKRKHDAI